MTPQMAKNNPGGVTHKWNLSETTLLFFMPSNWLTSNTATSIKGVRSLTIHWAFPVSPKGLLDSILDSCVRG